MNQLLLAQNYLLEDPARADVAAWYDIYKMVYFNITLVDRCQEIVMPYNFKNNFPMVRDGLDNFNKSYKEVCIERALSIVEYSRQINKPILIMYSGGIDSTTVMVSFLMAGVDTSGIRVALNTTSITENPNFYYNHIRGKFKTIPSEHALDLLNGEYIVVGGEFNDQLFGSDIYRSIIDYGGMELLLSPLNESRVVPFMVHAGMSENGARTWYSLLSEQIKKTNLCEVALVKDFFWWYNFCFKWQTVYYRIILRSNNPVFNSEFTETYYRQFFEADDFQRWSMLNPDKKIHTGWHGYKSTAKDLIYEYTQDLDYFKNKTKVGSLSGVFRQRDVPNGIDGNLQPVFNLNKDLYYQANNSFAN
jgi:hypothetical protein